MCVRVNDAVEWKRAEGADIDMSTRAFVDVEDPCEVVGQKPLQEQQDVLQLFQDAHQEGSSPERSAWPSPRPTRLAPWYRDVGLSTNAWNRPKTRKGSM